MYGRSRPAEPATRKPPGRGPAEIAGTNRISQSWNPKGVVRSKSENAGITTIRKDAVIRGLHPEPAEQVQLYASTDAERSLSLGRASSGDAGNVQTRREPGLNGDHRIGN